MGSRCDISPQDCFRIRVRRRVTCSWPTVNACDFIPLRTHSAHENKVCNSSSVPVPCSCGWLPTPDLHKRSPGFLCISIAPSKTITGFPGPVKSTYPSAARIGDQPSFLPFDPQSTFIMLFLTRVLVTS